jgi:nucleoside-diphosphate-sugar epimerase
LGSTGILGSALMKVLSESGVDVYGTVRRAEKANGRTFFLDTLSKDSIKKIPWSRFGVIVDCIGSIDYGMTADAAAKNTAVNVTGPMNVVDSLSPEHRYIYCSTHAVLLANADHNTYSLSKKMAEEYFESLPMGGPEVIVLRIPGLFAEKRPAGIIHKVKKHFSEKSPLDVDVHTKVWHAMYAPRAARIIADLAFKDIPQKKLTMGYPLESKVLDVVEAAEAAFGYKIPINIKRNETDHYAPNPDRMVSAERSDFRTDLMEFFKSYDAR